MLAYSPLGKENLSSGILWQFSCSHISELWEGSCIKCALHVFLVGFLTNVLMSKIHYGLSFCPSVAALFNSCNNKLF